jgi:hypothetical protein
MVQTTQPADAAAMTLELELKLKCLQMAVFQFEILKMAGLLSAVAPLRSAMNSLP